MKTGKYRHYWDTCIFLQWLSEPERDAEVTAAIAEVLARAERGEALIVTSIITRVEVLKSTLTTEAADLFLRSLGRAYIQSVNVDPRIALLAHDVRDFYRRQTPPKKLRTPDCIHLATAIHFDCDELNTRDRDLLPLNGNVMDGRYAPLIRQPQRLPVQPAPAVPPTPPLFTLLTGEEASPATAESLTASANADASEPASARAAGDEAPRPAVEPPLPAEPAAGAAEPTPAPKTAIEVDEATRPAKPTEPEPTEES